MQFSRTVLAMHYANRSRHFAPAGMLLVVGFLLMSWFLPPAWHDPRLLFAGEKACATVTATSVAEAAAPPVVAAGLFAHGGGAPAGTNSGMSSTSAGRFLAVPPGCLRASGRL